MVFVLSYIGIALVTFASFYLLIPAVTFCSTGFLCYVAALVGLWLIPLFFMDKIKTALTGLIIPGILLALVVLISIFTSPLFILTAVKPRPLGLGIQHWLLTAMLS